MMSRQKTGGTPGVFFFSLSLPDVAPLLHFACRLDVHVWLPESISARSGTALA